MKQLNFKLYNMYKFHEKWTCLKREGMGSVNISTKAPLGNIIPYIPLKKSSKMSPCMPVWNPFVKNIGTVNSHSDDGKPQHLSIICMIALLDNNTPYTNDSKAQFPCLQSNANCKPMPANNSETWREVEIKR